MEGTRWENAQLIDVHNVNKTVKKLAIREGSEGEWTKLTWSSSIKPCPLDLQKNLTVPSRISSSILPFILWVLVLRVMMTSGSRNPSGIGEKPPWGDRDLFWGDVILLDTSFPFPNSLLQISHPETYYVSNSDSFPKIAKVLFVVVFVYILI